MSDPFSELLDTGGESGCGCQGGNALADPNFESNDIPSIAELENAINSYQSADLFSDEFDTELNLEELDALLMSGADLKDDPGAELSCLIRLAESHPGLKISISFD